MMLATIDCLEDIKATVVYQKQLQAVYNIVEINKYNQLSVFVDFNAYGKAVLELLPHSQQLKPEMIKRIHHTFENDLVLLDIGIQTIQGQRQLEQLLAIAIFENINDVAGNAMARSVCLWLFDQPVTTEIKESLYKLGQAIDYRTHKQRYLRYWDPRVMALLSHIWSDEQKLQIYQLGLSHIHYMDWNNTLTQITLQTPNEMYLANTQTALEQLKPLPFRFSQQQWQLLEQIEWMNMILRQLKDQMMITTQVYQTIMSQALLVAKRQISQGQAVNHIIRDLERMKDKGVQV